MRHARSVFLVLIALVFGGALLSAAARAADCDEFDPLGPQRLARITLSAADSVDEHFDQLRTFVVTGSLGRVDYRVVSPRSAVAQVSAVPQVSRDSPYYGEPHKGIDVIATLARPQRGARVVVELRQVCAQHFRNSFLYY